MGNAFPPRTELFEDRIRSLNGGSKIFSEALTRSQRAEKSQNSYVLDRQHFRNHLLERRLHTLCNNRQLGHFFKRSDGS
jgi:hypothetical protein